MSFLKALNEAFDNYKCDECNELNESGKHFDLLMALKAARETLQRDGNNNLKAYEVAYQNVLEDYFPDKSWWEVTDCNIFNDLMETRDPEQTEINIIKSIHDDVDESLNESSARDFIIYEDDVNFFDDETGDLYISKNVIGDHDIGEYIIIAFEDETSPAQEYKVKDFNKDKEEYKLEWIGDAKDSLQESIWGNYKEFDPKDGWTEDDIDFYKTIDWSKSNHGEYEVDDDSFEDNVVAYGFDEPRKGKAKFVKVYRQNPIYPPYYRPKDEPFTGVVGPMADGRKRNGYSVHDRYETQDLYNRLSEARNPEHDKENEIIKRVYEPGRRKYSDVKKDIKKLGYEMDVDSDARKTFGRDYFGDKVKITNPKTGREIVGSQNATWKKDRFLRAGKNYMDYPGYNKDNKNSNRDEFDYKGFLDKPLGWKPSTEKSTVQQFRDDKQLVKDNQRVLDAADRLKAVRDRMSARKTNESLTENNTQDDIVSKVSKFVRKQTFNQYFDYNKARVYKDDDKYALKQYVISLDNCPEVRPSFWNKDGKQMVKLYVNYLKDSLKMKQKELGITSIGVDSRSTHPGITFNAAKSKKKESQRNL